MANEIPNYNDIIAYRPSLEPTRTIQSTIVPNEYYSGPDLNVNSNTVLQLSDNLPSDVIGTLDSAIDSVNSMLITLATVIPSSALSGLQTALVSGDFNQVNDLLKPYSADINTNTSIEIYNRLYRLKDELEGFTSLYSTLNYGGGVSVADASAQDETKVNTLLGYEINGTNVPYINYAALNIDVQLNKLASAHADTLSGYADELYSMATTSSDDSKMANASSHFKPTVESFFNDSTISNDGDAVKLDSLTNSGLINSSLYNVYSKRKTMLNSIHAVADTKNITDSNLSDTLNTYLDKDVTNSSDSIADFQKVVNMSAMYRDDYLTSLKTKNDLRNIYNLS